MLKIAAVIVGNEILAGRREDKHLANTIAALNKRHLSLGSAYFLGDDLSSLVALYQNLRAKDYVVLSYGGIGATPDDKTREAVAQAFSVDLIPHPEGMRILEAEFAEVSPERMRLVSFPQGADLIPNPINRIPGFSYNQVHCVPGFPQMAQPMIDWVLDTYYAQKGEERLYLSLMVEAPESAIIALMNELEIDFAHCLISSLPQIGYRLELGVEGVPESVKEAILFAKKWLDKKQIAYQDKVGA